MPKSKKRDKRNWEPREQRLVSEFVAEFYGEHESRTHVHLGSIPERLRGKFAKGEDLGPLTPLMRWADALVFMPDHVVLIEAKILPQPGVISQLLLYEELIPKSQHLGEHKDKPVEKRLVCAIEDPLISELARRSGIRVIIYRPKWIDAYLKVLHPWEKTPGLELPEE